jgi:hypothetical protein
VLGIVVTAGEESWSEGVEKIGKLFLSDEMLGGKIDCRNG